MTRFIAGIAVTLIVQLLGWPRIESAFRSLGQGAQTAYSAAESKLQTVEVGK